MFSIFSGAQSKASISGKLSAQKVRDLSAAKLRQANAEMKLSPTTYTQDALSPDTPHIIRSHSSPQVAGISSVGIVRVGSLAEMSTPNGKRQKTNGTNLLTVGYNRNKGDEQEEQKQEERGEGGGVGLPHLPPSMAVPMDVWADESPSQPPVSQDSVLSVPATSQLERIDLVGGGHPIPITFQPNQPHVPHQNPYSHLAKRQHNQRGSRPIRGPHRVPRAHEMEEDDVEFAHRVPSARSQFDSILNGTPPHHGHPQSYYAAAAASSSSSATNGVVDLTQDGDTPMPSSDEVQVLSHAYNPFGNTSASVPSYDPFADVYDPYAAAFRSASTSYDASPPPVAAAPPAKEITATQFTELSKEQQAVVLAIRKGENVFFSGCAGTGKSHLLKLLAQFLPRDSTFFTASTGLAAVNIGGTTLHSFAGVGLGDGPVASLIAKAKNSRPSRARWMACKVLVIDEISMIAAPFFDKIEAVARGVRENNEPFGGVQLVLSGDFLQLPPVKSTMPTFRAACWNSCIKRRIVLTKVFRQKDDPAFINLLNNLRVGQLHLKEEAMLKKSNFTQLPPKHGVVATKLNATKRDTADENDKELSMLPSTPVYFKAKDSGQSSSHLEVLQKNCPAPEVLKLKKGAQVMLLKNLDTNAGLCNGSRGIILDFVRLHEESGGYEPNPDQMSKADTIGVNSTPYYTSEKNQDFSGKCAPTLGNHDEISLLPRVQFDNGVIQVIESDKWEIIVQEKVQARRVQIPLTLAWALTIHKSQGMTLERAEINSTGMFENGQLYVAVSRVKSLQGLKLMGFTRDAMRTDHTVVAWYKQLEKETAASTAELLGEVEHFFPQLEKQLEEERIKNTEEEEERKRDAEIHKRGPFAQAAAAAAAKLGSAPSAPIILSPDNTPAASPVKAESNGFIRASNLVGSGKTLPKSVPAWNEPPAAANVAAPAAPVAPRPAPKPFRSPLKNPKAAAISNAVAESMLSGNDVAVAAPPAAAPPAAVGICCICKDASPTHAIFECMHLCLCMDCAENFNPHDGDDSEVQVAQRCPICQQAIKKIQKMFFV